MNEIGGLVSARSASDKRRADHSRRAKNGEGMQPKSGALFDGFVGVRLSRIPYLVNKRQSMAE